MTQHSRPLTAVLFGVVLPHCLQSKTCQCAVKDVFVCSQRCIRILVHQQKTPLHLHTLAPVALVADREREDEDDEALLAGKVPVAPAPSVSQHTQTAALPPRSHGATRGGAGVSVGGTAAAARTMAGTASKMAPVPLRVKLKSFARPASPTRCVGSAACGGGR